MFYIVVESAHCILKKMLEHSRGNLFEYWEAINNMFTTQIFNIKFSLHIIACDCI